MAEEERIDVVTPWKNLLEEIGKAKGTKDAFFHRCLIALEKSLSSMELMVYDMGQSGSESNFLDLLKDAEGLIHGLPALSSNSSWVELRAHLNKLERIQKRLEDFDLQKYVQERVEKLALSDQVADEQVMEQELGQLFKSLGAIIRSRPLTLSHSSPPVFGNIKMILDSLETVFYEEQQPQQLRFSDKPKLHLLLKEVELLLTILDGKLNLSDLEEYLVIRENELLKFVMNNDVLAEEVESRNKQYKELLRNKAREKQAWIRIFYSAIFGFVAYELKNATFLSFTVMVFAAYIFICASIDILTRSNTTSALPEPRVQSSNPIKTGKPKKCEIFLSFKGSDHMRYTVVGVFHNSLEKANISTFFDERGWLHTKHITEEIESAISTSVGAVTIFSEDYGESEYCLDELHLIAERRKADNAYIISPIFYDVKPEDILKPKRKPKPKDLSKPKDLPKPESKFRQGLKNTYRANGGKVKSWEDSLTYVVGIGGQVHMSDRDHLDELVDRVVEVIRTQLQK